MERIWKSTFLKGLNNDLDKAISPAESYLSAFNVTLSSNNGFLALANIKGTTEIASILPTFTGIVLAVYANKYIISGVPDMECLTIFTATPGGKFKILCYDVTNNVTYELFEQDFTAEFEASLPVVDVVCYPENGVDIDYFTDNYNEIRKLRCEIPSSYTPNFLSPEQLSLQRRGTLAFPEFQQVLLTGGSLVSGSYQFTFQFYNDNTKSFTKWTIPSTPIIISRSVSGEPEQGGYGVGTTKQIQYVLRIPTYDLINWTHYRIGVFENLQVANVVNGALQKQVPLTGGVVNGEYTEFTYTYKENTKVSDLPIEDVVVDLAAIQTVKTLQVKNNRLFGGNVKYWNRSYDNGDTVVSGFLTSTAGSLTDDTIISRYKGHFREEVYRYYISYYDEYYNYSRPKQLNMSSVTGNLVSNGDFKYPSRKTAGYTLIDPGSSLRVIGLTITVNNHPSWAKGFIILRAKRRKRIKFQSPFVPSSLIEGVETVNDYPVISFKLNSNSDGIDEKDVPTATPMNPLGTIVPKNLFFPVKKDIVRIPQDNNATYIKKGECKYSAAATVNKSNSVYFLYPPNVFGKTDYVFSQGDKYETVDYAFLRMISASLQTNTFEPNYGNYIQTSVSGSFYATTQADYYYGDSVQRPDPNLPDKAGEIIAYKEIDNIGEGTNISNYSVEQFNNLETGGIFYNSIPATQRVAAVALKAPKVDSSLYGYFGYGGNQVLSSSGGRVVDYLYEINEDEQSNKYTGCPARAIGDLDYTSFVDIINVVNDLGDDRYGASDDIHEMVFTGAQHVFSSSELAQIQIDGQTAIQVGVWGGDCFVNLQQVKITDNHYSLINSEKLGAGTQLSTVDLARRWNILYFNGYFSGNAGSAILSMPVPLRNVSTVLSVMVESEVLSSVVDPYPYNNFITKNSKVVVTETDEESKLRIPFSYGYNLNYSKESDQKAFIPFSAQEKVTSQFKARVVFSDQKIFQTDIQGFDIFRAANTKDLEETYGGITKLALEGNYLDSVQEQAISYLPVDSNVIETTDASVMAVRSGDVIGIPIYLSKQYGSQHLKSVISIDNCFFGVDNNNQAVFKVQDKSVVIISEKGAISDFNNLLDEDLPANDIYGIYDNNRQQYWIVAKSVPACKIYDDRLELWVGDYTFDELFDGLYCYNKVYLLGNNVDLKVATMYTGEPNQLFSIPTTSKVSFSVNPEFDYAKTFNNIDIYSTERLDTLDMETQKETGETGQVVTGIDIDVNRREGNYRVQVLRDSNNARLRGTRAQITLYWKQDELVSFLSSVITKYAASQRMI